MKTLSTLRNNGFSVIEIKGNKTQISHSRPWKYGNHIVTQENNKLYSGDLRGHGIIKPSRISEIPNDATHIIWYNK